MNDANHQNPGCLTALLRLFGMQVKAVEGPLPYRIRDDFLSPAELSFYHVLTSVVGARATICPKVNLSDIFFVARPNENMAYRGRIAQKHLDFLLCDRSMRPVVGIELDDRSHTRPSRQARDEFVDQVFQTAGLPLIHIAVQSSYNTGEIAAQLAQYLGSVPTPPIAPPAQPAQAEVSKAAAPPAPACPKCGVPMVVRTVARGEHQGKQFYGCPNYPKCREMLPLN